MKIRRCQVLSEIIEEQNVRRNSIAVKTQTLDSGARRVANKLIIANEFELHT